MNRRHLLSAAGAATGGLVASGLLGQVLSPPVGGGDGPQPPTLVPSLTVRAASPSTSDAGQPRGGPRNQAFQQSTKSPVSIKRKLTTLFPGTKFAWAPVINQNGNVLATDRRNGVAAVGDIQTQTETQKIDLNGNLANPGMFHDGNIIVGTATALQKVNPSNGTTIETINQDSRADILKIGDTGFTAKAQGMEKFDLDNFSDNKTLNMPSNPGVYLTTAIEDGDILPMLGGQGLSSYDTINGKILDTQGPNMYQGSSTDGTHFYAIENNFDILAAKIPKTNQESWSITDKISLGQPNLPIVVDDSGSDTWLYGATTLDGNGNSTVKAYSFNGISFTEEWTKDISGFPASLSKVGDTVLRGGDGLYLLNGANGNIIDKDQSLIGRANIMYNDLLAYTDPNNGGIDIYEMEMGQLPTGGTRPNLTPRFAGIPPKDIAHGETAKFSLEVTNSGSGPFKGDLEYQFSAGDAPTSYTASHAASIKPGTTLQVAITYTPKPYASATFSSNYDHSTATLSVTVPVKVQGSQATPTVSGGSNQTAGSGN